MACIYIMKKEMPQKKIQKKTLITIRRNFVGVHNEDTVRLNEAPALLMKEVFFLFQRLPDAGDKGEHVL